MSLDTALLAYIAAAALLTITPGLDTAMVLRTAAAEGPRRGAMAALGIVAGCLVWGAAAALGLGVLLLASHTAYVALKWAGALYLAWLGIRLIVAPRSKIDLDGALPRRGNVFLRGLLTNLLNPKVGVFYISFLPQFVPAGVPAAPFLFLLAAIHAVLGVLWFAVLVGATAPLKRWLQRRAVVRWLDRITGVIFVGFGLRLALDRS